MINEGPSAQDIERFSDDTGRCPNCGAEVWDQAEFCPECGDQIGSDISRRSPIDRDLRNRVFILIIALVVIGFVLLVIF